MVTPVYVMYAVQQCLHTCGQLWLRHLRPHAWRPPTTQGSFRLRHSSSTPASFLLPPIRAFRLSMALYPTYPCRYGRITQPTPHPFTLYDPQQLKVLRLTVLPNHCHSWRAEEGE